MLTEFLSVRGRAAKLARFLKIKPPTISQWKRKKRPVPICYCKRIEEFSGGSVTRKDLRPNDWPVIWKELENK